MKTKTQTATFGAGCFWHVQYEFDKLPVIKTQVGYMGGDEKQYSNPTYKQVCSHKTGYAEVINIIYNPEEVSYEKLVEKFFKIHNPTTLNRQGLDIRAQYRSVIFYYNDNQKKIAENIKKQVQKTEKKKIVTEISKAGKFFPAEEYHQKYMEKGRTCSI